MKRNESSPLRGLRTPAAPADLRERALEGARQALDTPPPSRWERAWESRGARLAWAASMLLLIGGHAALSLWPRTEAARPDGSPLLVRGESSTAAELAEIVSIPRVHPASTRIGAGLGNGDAAPQPSPSTQDHPSAREGKTS